MTRIFLLAALVPAFLAYVPPLRIPKSQAPAANRYIVKFKDGADAAKITSFVDSTARRTSSAKVGSVASVAGARPTPANYGLRRIYNATLQGISTVLSAEDLELLRQKHSDGIDYIESDKLAYASGVQLAPPSWGLARISQWKNDPNSNKYSFPEASGSGVDVYILDTGLRTTDPSFGGRASLFRNYVSEEGPEDLHGHGTHVAGIVASSKYGVAKKARVFGVKVLNYEGAGLYSRIISAIDHIVARGTPGKTVINLSLAGEYSKVLNDAMANARKKGILVVAAAGNEYENACSLSPASSSHVLTVGATDSEDSLAPFSNWGKCVDIYAPGTDIVSLDNKADNHPKVMSGTSMAAPHVAGVAALYLSMKSYHSSDELARDILGWSRRIVKNTRGGNTRLVYASQTLPK